MSSAADCCETSKLLQAHGHIRNHMFNFVSSMSLKSAVQLGIPDIIHSHGKPMSLPDLVDALKINNAKAPCMYRLMRILTHFGFFTETKINCGKGLEEEAYILAPPSKLLLKDDRLSMSPYLLAILDPTMMMPCHRLGDWFQNNDVNPFVTTHGKQLYELAGQEPRINLFFNEAMASDARFISSLMIENYKEAFEGLNSLVDIGGGTGSMAKAIADAFPHMQCTVLDLPHVVQGLEGTKNLAYVGGNMFDYIPPADAVFFKSVLQDWSDENAVKLFKKCKEAIPSKEKGGKVIIVDMVIGDKIEDKEATDIQLSYDMLVMILTGGSGRNEKEWAKLFSQAGFSEVKISPILGWRSVFEAYY